MALAILLFAIVLGAVGQILLKAGLSRLPDHPPVSQVLAQIFTNGRVAGGFACYAVSSLFYLVALSRMELSYAYPMIALSYVLVAYLSWQFLGERIPAVRILGLGIIIAGVVVMALSFTHTPAPVPPSAPAPVAQPGPPV